MKLAILGRSEGNGHPYSWSAIFNGYDKDKMGKYCPFPIIIDYLHKEPKSSFGIEDARVTHIWAEDIEEARCIARCTFIDNVVKDFVDVIGEVDGVIIAEDLGEKHLAMARPFIECNVPVFIDKPLCLSLEDLKVFAHYSKVGKLFMSCSSARYAREFASQRREFPNPKSIKTIHALGINSWEKYGIHSLEAIVPLTGFEFESVWYIGNEEYPTVYIQSKENLQVIIQQFPRSSVGISLRVIGEAKSSLAYWEDYFFSFKHTLQGFIASIEEGQPRIGFGETASLIRIIIAGIMSREQGGKKINLEDLQL